jgi:ligand-binding sensor domain-containing protein/signal transduction histidine kinase
MNIYQKLFIAVGILTLFSLLIPSQIGTIAASDDYLNFETITTAQGLSQNCINCIIQDHYGYMWFGTTMGLNKYDGISFKIYQSNSEIPNSLSDSDIREIYETSNGDLLIGTFFGLNIFNRETDTFNSYMHDGNDSSSISNNRVESIYEDSQGTLWIGTNDGLNIFNRETDTFISYRYDENDPDSISNDSITSIYEDSQGTLWIGTNDGLNIFNRETDTFISYRYDENDPDSISNDSITSIYEDSQGTLWIGTNDGLNIFNRETDTFISYRYDENDPDSISNDSITSIYEDSQGTLWIGTSSGLNRLNSRELSFKSYKIEYNNPNGINSNRILSLYKDSEGILWIGTMNGINKLNFYKQAFRYYTDILNMNTVLGICSADDKILWIQVNESIVKYDSASHAIEDIWDNVIKSSDRSNFIRNTFCIGIDGSLWIALGSTGLERFNPETGEIIIYTSDADNSLSSNTVTSLYTSKDGTIWIGTTEGLCSYDDISGFTQYKNNPNFSNNVGKYDVRVIHETSGNNLWFGTYDGEVYRFNEKSGMMACVMGSPEVTKDLSDKNVYAIYEDSRGLIWIGTGYGLYCYNSEYNEITSFRIGVSLSDERIIGILEDNNGNLWITTRQGLGKFVISQGAYYRYDASDGLLNNLFAVGGSYRNKAGELYFGASGGLVSFYPEDITINNTAPIVVINSFNLINGLIFFDMPIEDVKKITISYSDNSFDIDFVALSYDYPEYNQYAYKLEGFEENWNYCSAANSYTRYTNIPPGEYTFIVKASNSDGVWNEEGNSLKIIISTPFWKQWWFILSLIAAALLAVVAAIKLRTYTLSKYAQKLETQVEAKTCELEKKTQHIEEQINNKIRYTRALVHELKTPLTPLLASSDFLCSELEDKIPLRFARNINEGALNLSKRIDELLDLAKSETGMIDIKPEPIDLKYLIKTIIDYIKPEITKKNLSFNSLVPQNIPAINADEERLRQVVLNLLDNAIKYSPSGGNVTLKVYEKDNGIVIQIKDTGIGIDEKEMEYLFEPYHRLESGLIRTGGMGLGLFISKTIVELHGGHISVKSQKGTGSTFCVWLPINSTE